MRSFDKEACTGKVFFTNNPYMQFLKSITLFAALPDSDIQSFLIGSKQIKLQKNALICEYGDDVNFLYIVLEGWIKLYRINSEGEETIVSLVTIGDTFSEVATFEGSSYPYSAQVVGGNARLLAIDAKILRNIVSSKPEIALIVLASMAHTMNRLSLTYEHITKLTSAQRLGCFLLKLSMDRQYSENINLPYNKYLVASRLGMKAETFSRAMKRLTLDTDIVFKGREVQIKNIAKLQEYCEVECFNDNNCSLQEKLVCSNQRCDIFRILKLM